MAGAKIEILVDADACPVKEEIRRVSERYRMSVTYVANSPMRLPDSADTKLVVVEGKFDEADHWIAGHASCTTVVVTNDIPLAYRCIQKGAKVLGAKVLGANGHEFTEDNIGHLLATRDLMAELREAGTLTGGGPPPFQKRDRSRFLHTLDQMIQQMKRDAIS